MGRGRRQEVTGLTVNKTTGVPREDIRAFRSLLHRLDKNGPQKCTWRGASDRILAKVHGYSSYLHMVDAERYAPLSQKAETLLSRYGFTHEIRHPKKSSENTKKPVKKGGLFAAIRKLFGSS